MLHVCVCGACEEHNVGQGDCRGYDSTAVVVDMDGYDDRYPATSTSKDEKKVSNASSSSPESSESSDSDASSSDSNDDNRSEHTRRRSGPPPTKAKAALQLATRGVDPVGCGDPVGFSEPMGTGDSMDFGDPMDCGDPIGATPWVAASAGCETGMGLKRTFPGSGACCRDRPCARFGIGMGVAGVALVQRGLYGPAILSPSAGVFHDGLPCQRRPPDVLALAPL